MVMYFESDFRGSEGEDTEFGDGYASAHSHVLGDVESWVKGDVPNPFQAILISSLLNTP